MKKLLIPILLIPIIFLSFSIYALTQITRSKEEVIEYLKQEISKGNSNIEVNYSGSIYDGFGEDTLKEAISNFEYEKNNYAKVYFKYTKEGSDYILNYNIEYRTTKEQEKIIANYVAVEGNKILAKTIDKAEQVKLINDLIVKKTTYSLTGNSVYTAYGIISDGKAVCLGYTLLAERLLDYLNIENKIVIGYDNKNIKHSWNLVNINSNWYHLDITYNDTSKLLNEYVLKSDVFMSKTRSWNYYAYPTSTNNYNKSSLYVSTDSKIYPEVVEVPKTNTSSTNIEVVEAPKTNTSSTYTETKETPKTDTSSTSTEVIDLPKTITSSTSSEELNITISGQYPTREAFVDSLMKVFRNYYTYGVTINKTFNDTTNQNVLMAYNLGIVNGTGGNNFSPYKQITREEAAVMIYNTIKYLKSPVSSNMYIADKSDISSWAIEAINCLYANKIMNGNGYGYMYPKSTLTNSEALALLQNTFNYLK